MAALYGYMAAWFRDAELDSGCLCGYDICCSENDGFHLLLEMSCAARE